MRKRLRQKACPCVYVCMRERLSECVCVTHTHCVCVSALCVCACVCVNARLYVCAYVRVCDCINVRPLLL